jgi:hypothetical protein
MTLHSQCRLGRPLYDRRELSDQKMLDWTRKLNTTRVVANIQANDPELHDPDFIPHIDAEITEIITFTEVEKVNAKGPRGNPSPRFNILASSPTTNPTM